MSSTPTRAENAQVASTPGTRKLHPWHRLYARHYPQHTDPCSRHARLIADAMRRKRSPFRAAIAAFSPDDKAEAIEATVVELWRAREHIEKLEAEIARLRLKEVRP